MIRDSRFVIGDLKEKGDFQKGYRLSEKAIGYQLSAVGKATAFGHQLSAIKRTAVEAES